MKLWSKAFLIVLVLILASFPAFARVSLISPLVKTLENNESLNLGSMQPGEELEVFFNYRTGANSFWKSISADSSTVPSGWSVGQSQVLAESIGFKISVPASETERVQSLRLVFSDDAGLSESVNLVVAVRNDLVRFEVGPIKNNLVLGQKAVFSFRAVNQSLASHSFVVSSTLPDSSFKAKTFVLGGANSDSAVIDQELEVFPKVYGKRDFSFRMVSVQNQKTLDQFNETLMIKPTLVGKFDSGLFGLPVLSPNLNVFYFLNGLASLFQ
ncbi:MAG: hypothetical protein J4215_01380 [Candidatus Diapherotrites archaeon]|uniref:Uncharacterized protein n=1 Tax=Candidatus Iainarchaeum sp. TaxID=3101447 RepID=A0A8T4L3S4_9ARCH|nr:hypothetical protein [Candidatus Diapherotrites archaeon]